jgi:hypothetical protein
MGESCSRHGGKEKYGQYFWWGNLKKKRMLRKDLTEIGTEGFEWINLAQDKNK